MKLKQLFTLLVLVLSSFLSISLSASNSKVPFGIRHYDIGSAQNFTLSDIDGEKYELNNSKGHWVFLHFWASWCGPCRAEMPAIQQLADKMKGEKFQIIMINTAEDEDTIFEFLASINVELNSLLDVDGQVTDEWKPRGLPTSFLINPKGNVKYQAIGGREWGDPIYINFIKKLLKSDATK